MRKAIEQMLYTLNAQHIVTTETGLGAINEMKKSKFDIVLCDYDLGTGKNGQQVLEEAKYHKLLPFNAIFIIITAEQNQGMVLGAMDNKPDEYLTKPFNAQQLFSRLQRNFARKHYLASIEREIDKGNLSLATHNCEKLLRQNDPRMRLPLLKIARRTGAEHWRLHNSTDYLSGSPATKGFALGPAGFRHHCFSAK